jgi:hypothetical protein
MAYTYAGKVCERHQQSERWVANRHCLLCQKQKQLAAYLNLNAGRRAACHLLIDSGDKCLSIPHIAGRNSVCCAAVPVDEAMLYHLKG